MSNYKIIKPFKSFNDPYNATKKDAEDFYDWFLDNKSERLNQLEKFIVGTNGYSNWVMDFSDDSLVELSKWLKTIVEMNSNKGKGGKINLLDDLLISVSFDVGIYLGEALIRNSRGKLNWELFNKPKFIGTNHPVVVGFGKTHFNPRVIMQNQLGRVISGEKVDLRVLFETWRKLADK